MSMDASLGILVPLDQQDATLETIRELAARVIEDDEEEVLFTVQVEKDARDGEYFSTRPKHWQAEVIVEQGEENALITFYCSTHSDGMELILDKPPLLKKLARKLSACGLVGACLTADGERMLLTNKLKFSRKDVDWDDIPWGAEGVDTLAAVCLQK